MKKLEWSILVLILVSAVLLRISLTSRAPIALCAAAVTAMSQVFLTASSQIWSPSVVPPLVILYIYSVYRIFKRPTASWFLILGLTTGLIADSEAAFGTMLIIST